MLTPFSSNEPILQFDPVPVGAVCAGNSRSHTQHVQAAATAADVGSSSQRLVTGQISRRRPGATTAAVCCWRAGQANDQEDNGV
ncbi:hypothetical protein PoB_003573900 [Plakobranchus ocellatus]|uniref:Uncharacterized protein n=1 Tax=Plakobranchus ocellatus TaxID=259542 RepID=A0AAV4ASD2_9GAST|nr:hypothetical protein PoB_003573900 [Plakobranchus ocellatus]